MGWASRQIRKCATGVVMDKLQESEISDAKGLLLARGFTSGDFEFQARRKDPPSDGQLHLIRYIVKVSGQGKSMEYLGGHGLDWLTHFESDLKAW
jgi:hypothetical protein